MMRPLVENESHRHLGVSVTLHQLSDHLSFCICYISHLRHRQVRVNVCTLYTGLWGHDSPTYAMEQTTLTLLTGDLFRGILYDYIVWSN